MSTSNQSRTAASVSVSVVGAGRVGRAAVAALGAAGYEVHGPTGRGEPVAAATIVLLCVPDREIPDAATAVRGNAGYVGHTSGATPVADSGVDFGLHPLRAFVGDEGADAFAGIGCAVAGTTPEALQIAEELAVAVGGRPFEVRDDQRAGYHAAASLASNYLVTLEAAAERLAEASGLPEGFRAHLVPLVRGTVDNWAAHGPRDALTGPIVRGDEPTVDRQRAAVEASAPELLPLFDELTDRTRALVGTEGSPA
ncbi:DUF2520 domain-containing protein [Microbacterium flavescens]|uniref:DUF2520 domain-containing protein n=1 Tax=Microbacterium flavescens TaxID=69366 RepID=UPI001BDE8C39|nr:DUF2520 domain-containing protein [Microbacterium flavescens]BFF09252.1 hypothetical protein GCM10025699_05550 [Microbacterium flavescens]